VQDTIRWRRAIPSGLLALSILVSFWLTSRYPALDAKAGMGMSGRVELDALGFDHVFVAGADAALWLRTLATFGNWCATNKVGMSFGVVFAAAFLTFLGTVTLGQPKSRMLATLKGVFIGAPLGVCANCAAPVGQGLIKAGERTETVVATVVASPTLNVVVLTMVFGLFPFHIAMAKLAFTFVLLLLVIPALTAAAGSSAAPATVVNLLGSKAEPWPTALQGVATAFARNLWYIARTTLPWMAAAGLLGALVVEAMPFELFVAQEAGVLPLLITAAVGTFLPVPITFDVIVAYTLMQAGLDPALAAVLLMTLGAYSIYPAAILWRGASPMVATGLFAAVTLLGAGSGLVVGELGEQHEADVIAALSEEPAAAPTPRYKPVDPVAALTAACAPITDSRMRGGCMSRGIDHLALSRESPELCDHQPNPGAAAQCRMMLLIGARDAVKPEQVQAACKRMAPPEGQDLCLMRAAVTSKAGAVCALTSNPAACRAEISKSEVLSRTDPAACAALPPSDAAMCTQMAVAKQAQGSSNEDLCASLGGEAEQKCRVDTVIHLSRRKTDPELCARLVALGAPGAAEDCTRFHAAFDAIESGRPKRCLSAPDPRYCWSRQISNIRGIVEAAGAVDTVAVPATPGHAPVAPPALPPRAPEPTWSEPRTGSGWTLQSRPHAPRTSTGDHLFVRTVGQGLHAARPTAVQRAEPFVYGRGIAAGDIDGDGLPDLALGGPDGVRLYQNMGQRTFAELPVPATSDLDVLLVALVDLDGDERLDLVASGYGGTVRALLNDGERFQESPTIVSFPGSRLVTLAAGFGDLDRDGDLDAVLGNWSFGAAEAYDPAHSANQVVHQEEGLKLTELADGALGETLSVLISDLDSDGWPDVLVGNDGPAPDQLHMGSEAGLRLRPFGARGAPTHTSWFTMSYDAGDLDNDGDLDLFSADMSFQASFDRAYCERSGGSAACAETFDWFKAADDWDVHGCDRFAAEARHHCRVAILLELAARKDDPSMCAALLAGSTEQELCLARATPRTQGHHGLSSTHIPQVQHNTLQIQGPAGWTDRAHDMGVAASYWSWNSRFVDLDGDGWLDLHVGNGYLRNGPVPGQLHPNKAFWNREGTRFTAAESTWGLGDTLHTPTTVFADLDGDGDLDIVGTGPLTQPRVWWNQDNTHHALSVELIDPHRTEVGAQLTLRCGDAEQLREIRASGGFLSFDPPIAHFGLGLCTGPSQLEVRWTDGRRSTVTGLAADQHHRIHRGG
jgi:uncharacterized membrane protein YraQ (UPF0718 family)